MTDSDIFENLAERILGTIGDKEIMKANSKVELQKMIEREFFAKRPKSQSIGGDFTTSEGKTISELIAERYESSGKVSYIEDYEPKEYKVEAVTDKKGTPLTFVVRQYRSVREEPTERTAYVNQQRAALADRSLRRNITQLGFLRQVMAIPNAPRVVNPANFTIGPAGTLRVSYITSRGLIKAYTPRQIYHFLTMKGQPVQQG